MNRSKFTSCVEIEGMDAAVIGYALRGDCVSLIYDFTKIVKLTMKVNKLTLDEAIQMAENLESAWIGVDTPIIFHTATHAEILEIFGDRQTNSVN